MEKDAIANPEAPSGTSDNPSEEQENSERYKCASEDEHQRSRRASNASFKRSASSGVLTTLECSQEANVSFLRMKYLAHTST
jgi:hypothetical protein